MSGVELAAFTIPVPHKQERKQRVLLWSSMGVLVHEGSKASVSGPYARAFLTELLTYVTLVLRICGRGAFAARDCIPIVNVCRFYVCSLYVHRRQRL